MNKRMLGAGLVGLGLLSGQVAQAALFDRGGGLIYDDVLDITWLADANYAATQYADSGGALGDADGLMTWDAATAWAADLTYYDAVRDVTYDDWRLTEMVQPDDTCSLQYDAGSSYPLQGYGFNCTGSELGYMFYTNLGVSAGSSIHSSTAPELAWFDNLMSYVYWSIPEFAPNTDAAWSFYTNSGYQAPSGKTAPLYAWVVHPGDVANVQVSNSGTAPLPGTLFLMGAGLLGFGAMRRRGRG